MARASSSARRPMAFDALVVVSFGDATATSLREPQKAGAF